MKKLIGMKSNFSSLENKKMKSLQSIKGGEATNVRTSEPTNCGSNCSDTAYYKDGVKTMTLSVEGPTTTTPY